MTPRRKFIRNVALLSVGTHALLRTGSLSAAVSESDALRIKGWPEMKYTKLGRTEFNASRLVYGCGAALSRRQDERSLAAAYDQGVNVFDVGTSRYYGAAERHLGEFVKTRRDKVFLISKSFLNAARDEEPDVERAKEIASQWRSDMEQSLSQLGQEHVDAYYMMDAKNPILVKNEEIYREFERAKQDGKVSYYGLSTHDNAEKVLLAAAETGWYDLAMVAITPAGWYDYNIRQVVKDSPAMVDLKPVFDKAKDAGIALVGMKVARHMAGAMFGGRSARQAYDEFYSEKMQNAQFSPFQKAYAFVLEHGMDVVNADIQNFDILEENFIAAATSRDYVS
ncbi:MAG: aldo/keto reductase [Gammaproteobacteria bacterium]|nr:aldo/keto reductase [Gammaproteobacteria bacterium]